MMVAVEGWLRSVMGRLRGIFSRPVFRHLGKGTALAGLGFLGSAAALGGCPQPVSLGLLLALGDRRGIPVALGSILGSWAFWGDRGKLGIWLSMGGAFLGTLEIGDVRLRAALGTLMAAALGLWARVTQDVALTLPGYCASLVITFGLARLGSPPGRVGRWLWCGAGCLALGSIAPWGLNLGCMAAGALAVGASFPAAVLGGLGLDLAGAGAVSLGGLLGLAWLARFPTARLRWLAPGLLAAAAMALTGRWQWQVPVFLTLGGALGMRIPRSVWARSPDSRVGKAQVVLEQSSELLGSLQRTLAAADAPPIDREGILNRVKQRSCGGCPHRFSCPEEARLTVLELERAGDFPCRSPRRLQRELSRGREQLRQLKGEHCRREEYRGAVLQQLTFLGGYLRQVSDSMGEAREQVRTRFTLSLGIRSRGREPACGDVWSAFPGWGGRFYLVLCDGMGTGLGARQEAMEAARTLTGMLKARIPPDRALGTLNSLLTLSGRAGAVTVDLAEVRLDTGWVRLYKWGAAPSFLLTPGYAQSLGAPSAPPGLALTRRYQRPLRADLTRGQTLVLLSDGAQPETVLSRTGPFLGRPPGELAEKLLEGKGPDDATAAVLRLSRKG